MAIACSTEPSPLIRIIFSFRTKTIVVLLLVEVKEGIPVPGLALGHVLAHPDHVPVPPGLLRQNGVPSKSSNVTCCLLVDIHEFGENLYANCHSLVTRNSFDPIGQSGWIVFQANRNTASKAANHVA